MRVTISSSSSEIIAEKYKESARKVLEFLASQDCELNWGSGNMSIMGLCYEVFLKHERLMYGYTSCKYVDELKSLPAAKHQVFEDTFLLKKNIFTDASLVVFLPGGTGTISEFFAYLEEVRSNDVNKILILYNEYQHFDSLLALIDDMIARDFNKKSIYDYFEVAHNLEEFKEIFQKIKD